MISLKIIGPLLCFLALFMSLLTIYIVKLKEKLKKGSDLAKQIDESSEIEEKDREMLKSVFEFGDRITREIMVPRTEMITLEKNEKVENALKLFLSSGFSRIPVTGENADEIIGIAYFKDVAEKVFSSKLKTEETVASLAREAQFVPETKPVDDLFSMMQSTRSHIALVIDEYGGIAGLVTLEDTLEEIVGELDDEHDSKSDEAQIEKDGDKVVSCLVESRFAISDLAEIFEKEIEIDEVDTVLGLLTKLIGKVPVRGSIASINGLTLEAVSVSSRTKSVSKILVKLDAEN